MAARLGSAVRTREGVGEQLACSPPGLPLSSKPACRDSIQSRCPTQTAAVPTGRARAGRSPPDLRPSSTRHSRGSGIAARRPRRPGRSAGRVPDRALDRLRAGAARRLARRWRRGAAVRQPSAARARLRAGRRATGAGGGVTGAGGSPAAAGGGARDRAATERRGGERRRRRRAPSPAAARRRSPRDDRLHQRHHRRAQGRRHHPRSPTSADGEPDRGLGVDAGRSHRAHAAAPPRARDRQRARLRARCRCRVRSSFELRRRTSVGLVRARSAHVVHGGADAVLPSDPGLGAGRRAATRGLVGCRARSSPHGVGIRRAARDRARALARDHRPGPARALRHDRDRHDPLQPAAWRAGGGDRGLAAARGRGEAGRRHRRGAAG